MRLARSLLLSAATLSLLSPPPVAYAQIDPPRSGNQFPPERAALTLCRVCAGSSPKDAESSDPRPPPRDFADQNFGHAMDEKKLPPDPQDRLLTPLAKHMAEDQKRFWTAPYSLHREDARWLVPFAAFTGGLIAGDRWLARQLPPSASQANRSRDVSGFGTYALVGMGGASYLFGNFVRNDHLRETGLLAAEAALDSAAVAYSLKAMTQRQRPFESFDGSQHRSDGTFFAGGGSFPSEHAAIAWSVAGVVAHEYPGPLTKIAAYGLASAVTVTRVTGKQHFPSDVVVGSALGWYFARQIYRARHDPELGGTGWGGGPAVGDPTAGSVATAAASADNAVSGATPSGASRPGQSATQAAQMREDDSSNPAHMASPFVPLDSWVYSALERLAAVGHARLAFAGMKPWTRLACAQLVQEAGENLNDDYDQEGGGLPRPELGSKKQSMRDRLANQSIADQHIESHPLENARPDNALAALEARLEDEFAYELALLDGAPNREATAESAYVRAISISGPALANSYHFGQTVAYDFGRPFERGSNGQAGASFHAAQGPVAVYLRAEYQHAPSAPAPSQAVLNTIASVDDNPVQPAVAVGGIDRARLLDAYVTINLSPIELDRWQFTIGRESRSWGPGLGGSFLLSDNAEPFDMVELSNPDAIRLPSFLRFLGPARVDQFLGRLGGRTDHANPWIYGQKISFRPLPCLEIGYGRMTTIGGRGGDPFTFQNFALSLFGQTSRRLRSIPGDTDNEMDWTFYVPKARNYLVLYGEVYAEDDFIAWVRPTAYPFRPGLYLTRFPRLPKLDLHLEAASTEAPGWRGIDGGNTGQFIYFDGSYHQADTNRGFLMGNTVGRMGQALQGWLTWWAAPRTTLQATYKNNVVDRAFIPGGGKWQDYALKQESELRSGWYVKSQVQYERIASYPLLFSGRQKNLTAVLEIGVHPRRSR